LAGPRRSREPKHPLGCHDRALGLLAVRARSRRELEVRLLRAGFDAEEVRDELTRLEEVGLLDDAAFASALANHHLNVRGSGRRVAERELFAKGVDRALIDRTLADHPEDETDRAEHLARGRVGRLASLPREKAYARLVSFLARRGYGAAVAHGAARRVLELDHPVD
jgi:regulatory protein